MKNAWLLALASLLVLAACSGEKRIVPTPLDQIIKKNSEAKEFTVILYDMDIRGSWSKDYFHKYKVVTPNAQGEITENSAKTTDWMEVDKPTFERMSEAMGMEVAAKTYDESTGMSKVKKQIAPPGYSNYVGNQRYGEWRTNSSGQSFWAFYGQYMFMSNMMGLMAGPVYRNNYTDYRNNYARSGRAYYGGTDSGGRPRYGTLSTTAAKQNPRSTALTKSGVRSQVTRSASSRTSRSGSRSTGSSRSRSGFGGGK